MRELVRPYSVATFSYYRPYGHISCHLLAERTSRVMTALIFGIGIGLFIVLVLWIAAALVFAVSLRTEKRVGAIAVAVAIIVTVILVNVPRGSEEPVFREDKPYDRIFVWRVLLLVLLVLSSIVAFLGYVKFELLEERKPQKITTWVYR